MSQAQGRRRVSRAGDRAGPNPPGRGRPVPGAGPPAPIFPGGVPAIPNPQGRGRPVPGRVAPGGPGAGPPVPLIPAVPAPGRPAPAPGGPGALVPAPGGPVPAPGGLVPAPGGLVPGAAIAPAGPGGPPIGPQPRHNDLWYSNDGNTGKYTTRAQQLPEHYSHRTQQDSAKHIGPTYQNEDSLIRRQQEYPANAENIFEGQPPEGSIRDPAEKDIAGQSALSTMHVNEGTFGTNQQQILNGNPATASQISGQMPRFIKPNDLSHIQPGDVTDYMPGYANQGEENNYQALGGKDDGATGQRFYVPEDDFVDNNPLRVTSKEVDDYARQTAKELVGEHEGQVVRDPNTGDIVEARPHSSEKRRSTQHALSTLSRSLLTTFDSLNLDPSSFRLDGDTTNIHADDHPIINTAIQNYNDIAQNMDYLNVDKQNKWTGTPKYNTDGGISFDKGNGTTHTLTTEDQDDNDIDRDIANQVMEYNANNPNTPFYFNPALSNYKINVADRKSAVALSYTLRQFFDLQVLYYKKHMELLQVFQLLVIFFEKYNYSINSLMYILEHLIKDKIEVKVGDPIGVPIPIDFTKSIIGMLSDQKKMMTQVALFKQHLGMQDGGLEKRGDEVILPDDNMFLHSVHPGLFSNVATGSDGTPHEYQGPNKQYFSLIDMDPSIAYMNNYFTMRDEDRYDRNYQIPAGRQNYDTTPRIIHINHHHPNGYDLRHDNYPNLTLRYHGTKNNALRHIKMNEDQYQDALVDYTNAGHPNNGPYYTNLTNILAQLRNERGEIEDPALNNNQIINYNLADPPGPIPAAAP